MEDNKIRSIVKSLSYSLSGTFITILLVLILTKEIFISIGVGLVELIMKLIGYYFHERIWSIIKWGLKQ